jgi:hypothetical protein
VKVEHAREALPQYLCAEPGMRGLVRECEIHVTPRARLGAKVAVFASLRDMRRFWKQRGMPQPGAYAVVSSLSHEAFKIDRAGNEVARRMVADPRYFCLMTFAKGHLSMEIVSHESVHAGFAYAKRLRRSPFVDALRLDEEAVAYPAGRIARSLNWWLHKHGLYE